MQHHPVSNLTTDSARVLFEAIGEAGGYITVSHKSDRGMVSRSFASDDSANASLFALRTGQTTDVYVGIATRAESLSGAARGARKDLHGISLIGMDIDVLGPKKSGDLPSSIEEAIEWTGGLLLPPTMLVRSGNGLHAYWRLDEPIVFEGDEHRREVADLVRGFHASVADQGPWHFDSTHDLPRIFRVPGTLNFKDPNSPSVVDILTHDADSRYSLDLVRAVSSSSSRRHGSGRNRSTEPSAADADSPMVSLGAMVGGCGWLRHVKTEPEAVNYNEWFATASLLARVPNGRATFHEWSHPHPDYDHDEADQKFDQIDLEVPPHTCERIRADLGGSRWCNSCPFLGLNTPADLGRARPVNVTGVSLPEKTGPTWANTVLSNDPPTLFLHSGQMVRLKNVAQPIESLDRSSLTHEVSRRVEFLRQAKDGPVSVNPPTGVIDSMLSTIDAPLPTLTRVAHAPTYTKAGALLAEPGYDPTSGIYLMDSPLLKTVRPSPNPTGQQVEAAVRFLLVDYLGDFPFESDADRATALTLMLHDIVRDLIDGPTPLHLIDKPTIGTGATLLSKALIYPALGADLAVDSIGRNEEEVRKKITSHLLAGGGPINFDNINERVDSAALAAVLTSTTYRDRVLGSSTMAHLQNLGPWIGTGNNPTLSEEIVRRVVRCRLVSDSERPWERPINSFRHPDLIGWARENRADLVTALLTLVNNWLRLGRPAAPIPPMGSYESWSTVMGGILHAADIPGFLATRDQQFEDLAQGTEGWSEFLNEWWHEHQAHWRLAKQLKAVADRTDLCAIYEGLDPRNQSVRLGKEISKSKDRVFTLERRDGEVRVRLSTRKYQGNNEYKLEPCA